MTMIARRVFYEGRVQGVGFRWTVREIATGFEVLGTIRNLPDGRVELCVQGAADELDNFLLAISESQLAAHIHQQTIESREPAESLRGFHIIP
jgi:acylphosphatase